jgi:hypothetical protein
MSGTSHESHLSMHSTDRKARDNIACKVILSHQDVELMTCFVVLLIASRILKYYNTYMYFKVETYNFLLTFVQ